MNPSLLIASPQMKDPFFEKTVVLVWHHDSDGAIGVVINRMTSHNLPDVLVLGDEVDMEPYHAIPVGWGGPVEATSGTVITVGTVEDEEGWDLPDGLSVTRSHDALVRLLGDGARVLLCLGYAGWGPGQLDREIELGGWLWTDCSARIIFEEPVDTRYDLALASLGLTQTTVWMQPISE